MNTANEQPQQVLQRAWFVGFAGHRAVPDPVAAKAAICRELEVIQASVKGELVGIASAAAGADLLFLDACQELGLRTVVLLPFSLDRFIQDFDEPSEWEHARRCIDQAWWSEVCPGGEEAPAAYHVVARECLEIADRMLLLWNGLPAQGLGGTAETVRDAEERGIPSRVIDSNHFTARWNGPAPVGESDPAFTDLPSAHDIRELFEKLDSRANKNAPRSRSFAAGSMSVNHLSTVLQAVLVALALAATETSAMLKLILATIAGSLPWLKTRLQWQESWIRDRTRAELLRSLIYSHEPCSPLRPPALELFSEEKGFLRTVALQLVTQRRGWEIARDKYLQERLDGQIGYLKSKGALAARRMAIFGRLFAITSWGAVIIGGYTVISAYTKSGMPPQWVNSFNFLTAVLPGISAWSLAMISVFELKRRTSINQQLVTDLTRLRAKTSRANCASAVANSFSQIERLLLNELWEWNGFLKK